MIRYTVEIWQDAVELTPLRTTLMSSSGLAALAYVMQQARVGYAVFVRVTFDEGQVEYRNVHLNGPYLTYDD